MKPDDKIIKDAVEYFFHEGMIDNLSGDTKFYVKHLCDASAWHILHQDLKWEELI